MITIWPASYSSRSVALALLMLQLRHQAHSFARQLFRHLAVSSLPLDCFHPRSTGWFAAPLPLRALRPLLASGAGDLHPGNMLQSGVTFASGVTRRLAYRLAMFLRGTVPASPDA
jgi:hypothetical protein